MYVYNPFGTSPEDFDRETAGSRIGRRMILWMPLIKRAIE